MVQPLVSVVMANYNGSRFLRQAIESVLAQTYPHFELIIVDDGSTDASASIIQSYCDQRVQAIYLPENRQVCHASNQGIALASGEFVARIDSDDMWYPDKLEKQLDYMLENPACGVCFTWIDLIDENGTKVNDRWKMLHSLFRTENRSREAWLRHFFKNGNCLCNPTSLMRSSVLRQVGRYNLSLVQSQDFEFWIRFAKHAELHILQEPLTAYRWQTDEEKKLSRPSERNNTRFFNEHMMIRSHFFDDMTDENFIACFQEDFRNPDARTKAQLDCEKAFLLCDCTENCSAGFALGLLKLEELLRDPDTEQLLREQYQFTPKEFYQLNGRHIYDDPHLINQRESLERRCGEQQNIIQAFQTELKTFHGRIHRLEELSGQTISPSDE